LVRLLTREIAALQIPTRSAGLRVDSPAFISNIKATGCEIHYWTVNEADEMTRLIALGADGIVTDRTDIAVNTLLTAR
jgi:glycerophosphoryl diester phosphodiesterase